MPNFKIRMSTKLNIPKISNKKIVYGSNLKRFFKSFARLFLFWVIIFQKKVSSALVLYFKKTCPFDVLQNLKKVT